MTISETYRRRRPARGGAPDGGMGDYIEGLKNDCGFIISSIDWAVDQLTGWSMLEALFKPIAGDFNAVAVDAEGLGQRRDRRRRDRRQLRRRRRASSRRCGPATRPHAASGRLHDIADMHDGQQEATQHIQDQLGHVLEVAQATAEVVAAAVNFVNDIIQELLLDAASGPLGWAKGALQRTGQGPQGDQPDPPRHRGDREVHPGRQGGRDGAALRQRRAATPPTPCSTSATSWRAPGPAATWTTPASTASADPPSVVRRSDPPARRQPLMPEQDPRLRAALENSRRETADAVSSLRSMAASIRQEHEKFKQERDKRQEERVKAARDGELGRDAQRLQQRIDLRQTTWEDVLAGRDTHPSAARARHNLERQPPGHGRPGPAGPGRRRGGPRGPCGAGPAPRGDGGLRPFPQTTSGVLRRRPRGVRRPA